MFITGAALDSLKKNPLSQIQFEWMRKCIWPTKLRQFGCLWDLVEFLLILSSAHEVAVNKCVALFSFRTAFRNIGLNVAVVAATNADAASCQLDLLLWSVPDRVSRDLAMQNIKSDNSGEAEAMNQPTHPMVERPFFYLPQFAQPVPVQVQMQLPTVQPRNIPSATVNANRRCDICNKVFSTPGNCSIHKKKHNADNEKVQCEDCGKNFSTPGNLTIHKRIHSGEKAVRCDVNFRIYDNNPHLDSCLMIFSFCRFVTRNFCTAAI